MSLVMENQTISRVRLIDDDPSVRVGYKYSVEDLNLDPLEVFGPIADFSSLVNDIFIAEDAAICDYNLKIRNYSSINGDEVVAGLYRRSFPAVLCTRFEGHLPATIRKNLRYIPVVIPPSQMSPDKLRSSFETCILEFTGNFGPARRAHRAQVRVEGGEFALGRSALTINVMIPSWSGEQLIAVELDDSCVVYQRVANAVRSGIVERVFAQVNVGADSADELFLTDWSQT